MQQLVSRDYLSPVTSSNCLYDEIDEWCEDVNTEFSDELYDKVPCQPDTPDDDMHLPAYSDSDFAGWTQKSGFRLDADMSTDRFVSMDSDRIKRACLVCGDMASGLHYGIASCEACKAFFKRTVQGHISYVCPANGRCEITRKRRKSCQACRFEKCIVQGMNPDGIRPDRSKGGRYKVQKCSSSDDVTRRTFTQIVQPNGNRLLYDLLLIEPQPVYACPDLTAPNSPSKTVATLSNLADRELVATIAWAKQAPGFSSLALGDQMTLLQKTWIDILYLNFAFRAATLRSSDLVFSDDFKIASCELASCGLPVKLCQLQQQLSHKLASLAVNREEFILLKAMLLLNPDAGAVNPDAIESARHLIFDSLLVYEQVRGCRSGRRVGDLLLTLPLLAHLVSVAREFWRDAKTQGHASAHRLLGEMVEHVLQA